MHKADLTVLANEPIARHIYRIVLRGETAHHVQRPGQFVHIRCGDGWDMPLRRPSASRRGMSHVRRCLSFTAQVAKGPTG
nr:hypothetical protein [Novibacillus thermophilus]